MAQIQPKAILIGLLVVTVLIIIFMNINITPSFKLPDIGVKDPEITDMRQTRLGDIYTIHNPNRDKIEIEIITTCEGKNSTQKAILLGQKEIRYNVMPECELIVRKI